MQFAQPIWIFIGLFLSTGLLFLAHLLQKKRLAALEKFAASQLLGRLTRHVSPTRRTMKNVILVLAVFLLFVALARPQYGYKWIEVKRKGIDILFALDTSKSMLATDIKPNRLQRARFGIMDFVSQLQGDRIGLLPFAGSGYLMCPLTLDYDAFTHSLNTITTDIIPKGGTNISAVIEEAQKVLDNDANHKILVLLTDGENLQGDAIQAAEQAQKNGMTIYTVGVGTPGGELIPLSGKNKGAGFVKDEAGKYVTSKLDEEALTAIAEATEGMYVPLGNSGEGLAQIYQQKLELIPKEELAERRHKVPLERFSWPLTAAIVLLFIEFLIPERKSTHTLSFPKVITAGRRIKKHIVPLIFFAIITMLQPPDIQASEAEIEYSRENFLKASELYTEMLKATPDDPALHFNYGAAAYKNNMYDEAIASFSQALKGDDLTLQEKAYFNRGNAHYQKGVESQQADPKATVEQWEQALKSYDGALKLNPDDSRAGENKVFVQKKLEELQQQLEQQKENQHNEQDQNQENSENKEEGEKEQQQDQQQATEDQSGADNDTGEQNSPDEYDDQEQNTEEPGNQEQQPEANRANQQNVSPEDQDAEAQRALERRELGKMTQEEAENLLNALKNEEGELNFVPGGQEPVRRDW